jgi:hypothetical protein
VGVDERRKVTARRVDNSVEIEVPFDILSSCSSNYQIDITKQVHETTPVDLVDVEKKVGRSGSTIHRYAKTTGAAGQRVSVGWRICMEVSLPRSEDHIPFSTLSRHVFCIG